jgi:multicomponent Na+:H+ antiporter subunit G
LTPIAAVLSLVGALVALLAGIGLLRFRTPYARFHAAGKASPVAFLLVAAAASIETGWGGAARLAVASAALVLTLPVGVHLLFRAVHRTTPRTLAIDELSSAETGSHPRPIEP